MVRTTGFEPVTPRLGIWCKLSQDANVPNGLRATPVLQNVI